MNSNRDVGTEMPKYTDDELRVIQRELDIKNIIWGADISNFEAIDRALEADPNAINYQYEGNGVTALHVAAGDGNLVVVQYLLDKPGIDLTIRDYHGRDALDMATYIGAKKVIEAISERMYPRSFSRSGHKKKNKAPGLSPG